MSDVIDRLEGLSPERQALLREILRRKAVRDQEDDVVRPREGGGPAPLSFAQQRLWLLDRLVPGSSSYNLPIALHLGGALDVAALERALGEIVRRHESLRTTFAEIGDGPVQVVAPADFVLPVEEISALEGEEREATVRRRAAEDAARPFDLAAGPLFRAALLRLGDDEHVLLLCLHHIVGDGWSLGVLFRELGMLYGAYRDGGASPLPDLPVQYADYAVWQRDRLQGETLERELAYWRERLAGAPALLELPTDHPRPAVQTSHGARVPVSFPPELLERLRELGRREDATPFMVLLAAFQVLLAKYAGSHDVVVGTPIAGRTRGEVEGLIGFFINTLVLRTGLSGDPPFRELLGRVREGTLGAYEHQQVPFEKLVAELQPERSLSHAPLFQVAFSMQAAERQGGALPGLQVRSVGAETGTAKFDLSLTLSETPRGLWGSLEYSTDLFERETALRMVEHLGRVLEQVAADADARLSALELLSADERALVVEEWNRTETAYPRGVCIHDLFAAQVRARPDAEALAWGDLRLTYAELDARANRLAHHLAGLGVGPEVRVGVLLERGPELIVSLLAIVQAGGCYVPLDPGYPAGRLELMLADAGVRVLLSQRALLASLDAGDARAVDLDEVGDALEAEPAGPVRSAASPENLAYIVYTSGSTGKPKGVMVAHRHVVQLVVDTDYVRLGPGDRVAQASNASFDALTFEAWGAFLNGATLVGIPREVLLSPPAVREFLRRERITTLYQTTALLNQLTREQPDVFATLREVLFGGQASDADRVRALLRSGKPRRLLHMYGPTETTAWCSWEAVEQVADDAPTVSVGRPTGNQRIYVLDGALRPTPVGIPGEAYVGGDGIVRGYLDRPGLTAERFLPDPFSAGHGARMYRTGDRLRWRAGGRLEFVGRLDEQVKIRGFRIEPGEVESLLSAHAEVREARVIVREDEPGEKRLVAYVVGAADAGELRAYLRRTLPEYMLPAAFVVLERLPLTPNGKLDVKSLPAPELASDDERYVAPRTPLEEVLAEIWAEVLRVERVGVHDGFFELGGHSLLATRVVSRVREILGVELPLRALFEGPTVSQIAERVEEIRRAGEPQLPPVVPVGRGGALPLSFSQERLWFLDRMEPGRAFYNIPVALRLTGALDAAALERALGEIVRRHESLRTTFAEIGDGPVQVIAPADLVLPVEDLSSLDGDEREAIVRRRAAEDAARPFDLAAGPLFRAALLRLGDEEHVLFLCMHHIVGDGWSLGVLFRELGMLYGAYRDGGASPLPDLPVQYADFAAWQRETLRGERLERELAWWKERLAGAPALLELPTDHPRPAVQTYRGAHVPVRFPAGVSERLRELGRREGATPFMVLLGAFQVLLAKYAGSDDVVVGSPIAGRTRGEVEGLIGFFVNTLVLRTDLSGDPSFHEVLGRVREGTLGAYEHQQVPFEKLVAELQPERSLSHAPLFQVAFSMQNADRSGGGLPGVQVRSVAAESETAKFDLSLTLSETPHGLAGAMEYSTDLFERDTVLRMVEHLGRVLEQVAGDAAVRLSGLDLLSADERALVLEEWNRTETDFPREACVHQLFEARAERNPDATAVLFEGGDLTYAELNGRANRLAHHLRALGVGPEVRVALAISRSPELVEAELAVLKSGGAYVPLDPDHPDERLREVLADSAPAVLLTTAALADRFAGLEMPVLALDAESPAWASAPATNPAAEGMTARHLAYVMYTSGSTGRPKGVMITHRSIVRLVVDNPYAAIGADDRVAFAANPAFDATTMEVWAPLVNGGAVVVIGQDTLLDPPAFARTLEDRDVTTLFVTTAVFNRYAEAIPGALSRLRFLLTGGENNDPAAFARVLAEGGAGTLIHCYGPTETTTYAVTHAVREVAGERTLPLGRPIGNTRVYLLDRAGEPVPVGVAGEMYIGGPGVARGYLDRPALTAERFVADPFSGEPGARLYRTGDLARWLVDGTIEFLGRTDHQVKVRGFRIEPGEIEARLLEHPGVREAIVVVREDAPGDKRLVAYVAGDAGAEDLRAYLGERLPAYMVPAAFVLMDRLPLNPNGKVDRKALPAPEYAAPEESYVAPRNPLEEVLAEVWAEVLRVDRVGVHDGFFDLGGHSLLATRVVSRIREILAVELPLRALFEGPTVAELAERVEEIRRAGMPQLPPVVPAGRDGALPLSFSQERLWFLDRMEPGSAFYNVSTPLRLSGALDGPALERALGEIVRRHEALRTTFAEVRGAPVQVVAPFDGFVLPVEDLSALAGDEREAAVRRRTGEEAARPFDLAAGPLFRAVLLRLGEDENVLLLSMHHIVSDGWSMRVIFRELAALYEAYRKGEESRLPPLPVQYADFAAWQRETLRGERLESELGWWKERLAGAPALLELPADHPRPAVQTYRGAFEPLQLPAALADHLRALARREGATLYMVLLGAFQVLLAKYSGSEDVVVGSPIAGRTRAEVEGLIGFFVNTLVLRTDLSGDPSFRELLRRVRERTLEAYEHQQLPFEKLVAELQPERSLSHAPLFQVAFSLQNTERQGGALPGLQVRPVEAETETAKFDLSLTLSETPRGLGGALEYSTDLFERDTIRRMIEHLGRVLEQVAADADARLSALELLSADERVRVLEEWNRTETEFPRESSVHQLFEARAEQNPDATAVVFDGGELTYAELNARANRLAHHLRTLGVGPESRVALAIPRSAELVEAELAVLKSGGAYVPLDPDHPDERLREVLADSTPAALLTTRALADRFAGLEMPVLALDADAPAWASAPSTNPAPEDVTARHLAYVMYTSGSTGRPKGVMVTHRSIVRLVVNNRYADFGAGDRVAFAANPAFDATTMEVWAPLVNGGAVVIVDQDTLLDPNRFATALRTHGVTVLWLTVGLFNQYAEALTDEWPRLRYLIVGGDALDPRVIGEVLRRGGPVHLLNGYGPTETTTFAVTHEIRAVAEGDRSIPLGRPIGNTRVYLLDGRGEPVPVGVAGELCIGGAGVARGYLGRPELTAERFVPDAFGGEAGARLYRTGDLARWRTDGTIEFLGRTDYQVKVRGFRIELGEIEARLAEHPGVRETVVLAREDALGDKRLVAYVAGDDTAGAEELRAYLGERLPAYMVPAAYVRLDRLPLTPNGKVDRRALPAPEYAAPEASYVAPRNPLEEVLAEVWAEVLRVERVGIHDSFFELGGHSLLAVRMVSRIREVLGVELPLRALFEDPTVAALAERVEEIRRAGPSRLPPVLPVARDGALPLSLAQERLWFLQRMEPESIVYNVPLALRLRGALDVASLERALGEIVRRHEALRTTFAEADGSPSQVVHPFAGFALPVDDLSSLSSAERETAARRRVREDAERPFDLAAGPLFRASLVRLAAEDHLLLVSMHHVVTDGWSMGVLLRELSALYGAYRDGRASPLAEPAVQYGDYAVWQREQLGGDALARELGWWRARLAGAPTLLELPTDHPRPAVQTFRGAAEPVEVPAALVARLRALGRGEGATLYMVVLAAFQSLLGWYAGSDDVLVGTVVSGRARGETEGVIGFFVNTLVLRADLSGDPDFRGLLRRVRDTALGAWEHQEVPFERVVAAVQPQRSLSHSPLFQVSFSLDDAAPAEGALPGLETGPAPGGAATTKFDLTLGLTAGDDGLRGSLVYCADLFEPGTIRRMGGHLRRLLEQVAGDPGRRLSGVELLTEDERRQVLEEWNRSEPVDLPAACIHHLFEAQAARTSDAPAVVFEGDTLTYAQLNARANRLARHLSRRGAGPEARVAVCLERGAELVVALLAVMKAGAAYVPLDPAYPAERLALMLADAGAAALVTQASLRSLLEAPPGAAVVSVDGAAAAEIARESGEDLGVAMAPRNLAYLIYTSGSTGIPKGVAIEHGNAVALLAWAWGVYSADELSGVLASTSICFDLSVFELFVPLTRGGCVIVVENALALPASPAAGAVRLVNTVPSAISALLESGGLPAGVRTVNLAGEPLRQEVVEALYARGVERVYDLYGPSEDTTYSTCGVRTAGGRPHIGRAIANTRCYVLDGAGRLVPAGVSGELYIGGLGVVRGYRGRPGLTAERFVPDPFADRPGARMYRTGDRVRWKADTTLEYLGRLDHQVKIRGFRIEPGEIEAVLRRHPGVDDCAVIAREDAPGDRRLAAYVVGAAGADELRAHLRRHLPGHMVPGPIVPLAALPLTPNGKVDRRALPAPAAVEPASPRRAAETELEARVAAVWAEVLGVGEVGVEDNFFDLGGHSLLLVRLQARLAAAGVGEVAVVDLFQYTTVRALAGWLSGGTGAAAGAGAVDEAGERGGTRQAALDRRLEVRRRRGGQGT